jgi:predicted Zn finger-like uncharacterized protein
MSMVTRCPSCETLFRVTPQQLRAHGGQVRCGRCMTVFDGLHALATSPEPTPAATPLQPATETATLSAPEVMTVIAADAAVVRDAAVPAAPEPVMALSIPAEFDFEPIQAPAASAAPPVVKPFAKPAASEIGAASRVESPSLSEIKGDASFLARARSAPRRGPRAWRTGSALMLVAVAGQAAYFYRSDLVANYPVLKPAVEHICEVLECNAPPPQRPKLINIEASDLQILDPARPAVIQLTATLRNHAGYDLGYPALDLVLTNTKEHTLARRVFLPEDYLEKSKDLKSGLPANAEVTVRLDLDTGELGAAGFRLGLLPAPTR